jgi:hypothetical protein
MKAAHGELPPATRPRYEASMTAFERAHGDLQRAAAMIEDAGADRDLERASRAVEVALRRLYDAVDGRSERVAAILDVEQVLDRVVGELNDIDDLRKVLARARESLREAHVEVTAVVPGPIAASDALPRLHAVSRASLTPALRVAPAAVEVGLSFVPLEPPTTPEALEGFGDRQRAHIEAHLERVFAEKKGPPPAPPPPSGEARFVTQWARECFDEIAMLASQRRPLRGDDWRATRDIETRMLACLDALASLGAPALAALEGLVLDAPAPDPERGHALAFVCSALAGRDALGMVERIARAHARDDKTLDCIAAGLRHAPHPALGAMLHGFLDDDDAALRELAARVLSARNALSPDRLEAVSRDRPEIARHALLPLATAKHPALDPLLARALEATQSDLRQRAWIALALGSKKEAAVRLRQELGDETWGDRAATLLAALGTRGDAEAVCDRAARRPSPASLHAAAIAGHVPTLPRLVELLRHADLEIALAAAQALERVTGAGLFATVELSPEAVDAPEIPEPPSGGFAGPPLGRHLSDSRDAPGEGSADRVELADPSHARWSAFFREHPSRFEAATRYRGGEPFSAVAVHAELSGPRLTHDERRAAGVELLLLTGHDAGFDVDAFVSAQLDALAAWLEPARARSGRGAWAQ